MATTLSTALIEHYGGELAAKFGQELSDVEDSLAGEWPTWNHPNRSKRKFRHLPNAAIGRIKLLIKRRALILRGLGDYGLRLSYARDKNGRRGLPFAIMVKPRRSETEASEAAQAHHRTLFNIESVSRDLEMPIEKVEEAALAWRGVIPIRKHVTDFHAAAKAEAKLEAEAKPKVKAPKAKKGVQDASA